MLALQRDRWILWLPLAQIAGASLWLLSPVEPHWLSGPLLALSCTLSAVAIGAWAAPEGVLTVLRRCLAGAFALAAAAGVGVCAAQFRAASVHEAPLAASDAPRAVEGWVTSNDAGETGPRLRLLVRSIEGVETPPRYVRVAVREAGRLSAGRAARCYAVLGAPAGPMAPGAYDFARRAYFERLAATGYAYGRCRPQAFGPPAGWLDRQRLRLAAVRADLSAAIQHAAPGRGGAIAAALVTGDRSSIDKDTNDALRDSGLGHLLSVSGIHMGVVGGLTFALLLWSLSLIAPIALRFPVKKLAAAGALMVLGAYLVISGSSVPALRAFVMACVAFGAILLDRPAISMRGLALAAVIVTLLFPESVLEPGFQMSFAATMALVALFEIMKQAPHEPALPTPGPLIGALQATMRGIGGVLLISFVAGLATDPFAIYHFQRFSLYALPANLIAAPIMSFLVAPAAAAAVLLAPLGWSEPALQLMASALDMVAAIGATFGERPEAVRALPRPPDAAFLLCSFALIWACVWRGGLRWLAAPMLAVSIGVYIAAPRPVVAFDADLRAVFARVEGANLPAWTLMPGAGRSTYARDRLGAMLGLAPAEIERLAPAHGCGDLACVWRSPGGAEFALVRAPEGFEQTCRRGAVVISAIAPPSAFASSCAPAAVLDETDLATFGGGLVYETDAGLRFERARPAQIQRAWTRRAEAPQA